MSLNVAHVHMFDIASDCFMPMHVYRFIAGFGSIKRRVICI
jgi:hypothetical protein